SRGGRHHRDGRGRADGDEPPHADRSYPPAHVSQRHADAGSGEPLAVDSHKAGSALALAGDPQSGTGYGDAFRVLSRSRAPKALALTLGPGLQPSGSKSSHGGSKNTNKIGHRVTEAPRRQVVPSICLRRRCAAPRRASLWLGDSVTKTSA